MTNEQAIQMLDVIQKKSEEIFEELRIQLSSETSEADAGASDGGGHQWTLSSAALSGAWKEVESVDGQSYRWPDGNVDDYTDFVIYEGSGEFDGMTLALGHKDNGEWVGFVFEGGLASKRGIVYFQLADDFDESAELVSMIRGGGENGRSGFAPTDPPPPAYADFQIESLKGRKAGKWNVQAVVAASDDAETMLNHTAIQARLRGLA
jgi:hypothetical protein